MLSAFASSLAELDFRFEAQCGDENPDLFFEYKNQGSPKLVLNNKELQAKQVCARCPVTLECLEYALKTGQQYGIWGGKNEKELKQLRRLRSRKSSLR